MKQHMKWDVPTGNYLLLITFFLGGLIGFLAASLVSGEGDGSLAAFFQVYFLQVQQQGVTPNFLHSIWTNLKLPLYLFLCGFSLLGTFAVPLLFATEGFLFTFSISTLCRLLGVSGIVPSFFLFCLPAFLHTPILFFLGTQSFRSAQLLWQRIKPVEIFSIRYFGKVGIGLFAVFLSILFDFFVTPILVEAVLPFI